MPKLSRAFPLYDTCWKYTTNIFTGFFANQLPLIGAIKYYLKFARSGNEGMAAFGKLWFAAHNMADV